MNCSPNREKLLHEGTTCCESWEIRVGEQISKKESKGFGKSERRSKYKPKGQHEYRKGKV